MIPKVISRDMKTSSIKQEVMAFLESSGMSVRRLAREAGINPSSLLHLSCGGRNDLRCSTADKVRAAIARLSAANDSKGRLSGS